MYHSSIIDTEYDYKIYIIIIFVIVCDSYWRISECTVSKLIPFDYLLKTYRGLYTK